MNAHLIDDSPMTPYHRKLIWACGGGPFLDGYLLSIIGVALAGAGTDLDLDATDIGLAGAVSLIGLFFGSLIFGPITDRIGRRVMYTADLLVMIVGSALCLFIGAGWQLIVLRFVIGAAVGADYPIATSLLTEWIPKKQRGAVIGLLSVIWLAGAIVAYLVGFIFTATMGERSWRWMLASGAVWGIVVLLLRMGTHESPRWLISRGRIEQARDDVSAVLGRAGQCRGNRLDGGRRERDPEDQVQRAAPRCVPAPYFVLWIDLDVLRDPAVRAVHLRSDHPAEPRFRWRGNRRDDRSDCAQSQDSLSALSRGCAWWRPAAVGH